MRAPAEVASAIEELMREHGIVRIERRPAFGIKKEMAWHVITERGGPHARIVHVDPSLAKALTMAGDRGRDWSDWKKG